MGFTNFTAAFPGSLLAESDIGLIDNRANFTLDGNITSGASSLTVNEDTTSAPTSGVLTIENERILYTSKNDGTKTFSGLTRGYDGSNAASHDDDATVHMNVIAGHHNRLTKELIALQGEVGATGSQNFVRTDGSEPLTANWGVGGFDVTNVGTSQADTFEVINAGAGTNPTLTSNAAGDQTSLSGDFSLGGTNLILTQATADYTVTWADPSSARTLTIDDPGANVDFTFRAAGLTAGSVPFSDANGNLIQDNANLFWDDANSRLGIQTSSPTAALDARGGAVFNEDAASVDLRVESTSETNMLLVSGAQDQVNVHTNFNADWGALNVGVRDASAAAEVDMVATLGDSTDSADIQNTNVDVWGVRVGDPTINSAGGATTVTDSAALYVPGPIQAGTDVTITNQYVALMEDGAGNKLFRFTATGDFETVSGNILESGTPVVLETRTLTGGDGIQPLGDLSTDRTVAVDLATSGGLKITSTQLAIEPADFAGTGVEDDGSDNLRVDQSFAPAWTGLHTFNGGVVRQVASITGDGTSDTLTTGQYYAFVDSSTATHTVNLPATPSTGQEHVVKRNGANTVTVSGNGNNIQEGTTSAATFDLENDGQRVTLAFDGTLWRGVD